MIADCTLLLVDDIRQDRLLMGELLSRIGYDQVAQAESIAAGEAILHERSASLILLNTSLPDARAFCRKHRSSALRHIPIIALIPPGEMHNLEQILAAGAHDYLAKPIHARSLAARVTAALLMHEAEKPRAAQCAETLNGTPSHDRLEHALVAAQRSRSKVAVAAIQVVHNMEDGVDAGLLQELAARIQKSLRGWDTFCQQDGGRFVVILSDIAHATAAAYAAARLNAAIARPCFMRGQQRFARAAMGISVYPDDAADAESLLKAAQQASDQAMQRGGQGYSFFNAEFDKAAQQRLALENALRHAIDRGELVMYYQPQVDAVSGRILGAEALLRWQHPELGLYTPDKFIAVTEDSALIIEISSWMLREVCRQNAHWQQAGLPPIPISVHFARQQFRQGDLPRLIAEALAREGLAAKWLELEVSETSLAEDREEAIAMLNVFRNIGVNIALADFGCGFSCLTHFRRIPLQRLEIAQELVAGICSNSDDREIVNAIISMGKNLHLRVIAKGVETEDQLKLLQASGCGEIQGYLFGHPMPAADFEALLGKQA